LPAQPSLLNIMAIGGQKMFLPAPHPAEV